MLKIDKRKLPYDDYCRKMYIRRRNSNYLKIFLLILMWSPLVFYYFSPFSKSNIVSINGNALNFDENYIYECTSIEQNKHIWNINPSEIEKQLIQHPYCSKAEVILTFSGIKININEIKVVAKNSNNDDTTYYFSNGSSKTYSSIKDSINDPLSTDFKFIKPYLEFVPTINKDEYKNDDFNKVVNELGNIHNDLLKYIKDVKVNDKSTSFTLISLTFDKEQLNIDKDLVINVDYRDIDKLLSKEIVDTCINKIKENNNLYYNVLIENDIENKQIKVVPMEA